MIISSAFLCTAIVLAASATSFYSRLRDQKVSAQSAGYFDEKGFYHHAVEPAATIEKTGHSAVKIKQQQSGAGFCHSVIHSTGDSSTYLHVCESGVSDSGIKEYCFITNGPCCIVDPENEQSPIDRYRLSLEDIIVNVNYYGSAGSLGVCYTLDKTSTELPPCGDCSTPNCILTRCLQNTKSEDQSSCTVDGCECKEGFAPSDCCEYDLRGMSGRPHYKDPDTGECKLSECQDKVVQCSNGMCTCQPGYLAQDCCDCDEGYYLAPDNTCKRPKCEDKVVQCSNGVCTCQAGYLTQDCCECDVGYYKAADGNCKAPCENVERCINGVCTCNKGFKQPDCCGCQDGFTYNPETGKCVVSCVPEQDFYFVIDTALSNDRHTFCQTHYTTELLLRAIKPGNSSDGPRVEIDLFSKSDTPSEKQTAYNLFKLGTGCEAAIGETLNLVDAFYNRGQYGAQPRSPYWTIVGGSLTYPASAIELVKNRILDDIDKLSGTAATDRRNRRRVVVIYTGDKISSGGKQPTYEQMEALKAIPQDPSRLNVISVGNDRMVQDKEQFRDQLEKIAGDDKNVVIADNALDISQGLVKRMAAVGSICREQEKELLDALDQTGSIEAHCYCIGGRGSKATTIRQQCLRLCPGSEAKCRVSPEIQCPGTTYDNPYYVASPSYKPPTVGGNLKDSKTSQLEEEILHAVEEVLHERMKQN